jgi:hypothetical protein
MQHIAAGSGPVQTGQDGLPTELAVEELVTAERLLKKRHKCVCDKAMATFFCLDCHDLYCGACKVIHKRQQMARHHRVEDLRSLTADQLVSGRPSPCPYHR